MREGGEPVADQRPYVQGVHLQRTEENVHGIEALASVLGPPAGLPRLLADLTHQARRSAVPARLLGRAVTEALTWDRHDRRDRRWWPQGISTSADASETEEIRGRRMLVTSWYSRHASGATDGSRVTFLDLETLRYRHVLLVVPRLDRHGHLAMEPLRIHAGGLVWAGPYLHIAATGRGLITARVDDVMRVAGGEGRPEEFGFDGTRLVAYGHRYVLPVRFGYQAFTDDGHHRLRYSFLSLDRRSDPPALVAGEYSRGKAPTRLARYRLDPGTWQLPPGDDGFSRPLEVADGGVVRMQGAVLAQGRYHVSVSHGRWLPGTVYAGTPGRLRPRRAALPMGPEDLAYWPSTDRIWSLTEHPHRRWIVAMRRSWFD